MKKSATKDELSYMGAVKELSCAVCDQPGPSDAHHVRTGQGMSQRAGNYCVVPLCNDCHQGKDGIHGTQFAWKLRKMSEMDALDHTIRRMTQ